MSLENAVILAENVCKLFKEGSAGIVLVAPTGFGKTLASPLILKRARNIGLASNLIHVVPTRALVREIYYRKFNYIKDFSVGYQSQDKLGHIDKSPFYLRDIVVTTLDSFLWNIYRIPVGEFVKVLRGVSQGHYYPVLSSILTSIVVLDEAHIYLGGLGDHGDSWASVTAVLYALERYRVPFVIETATFPSSVLSFMLRKARVSVSRIGVLYVCSGQNCNKQIENLKNLGFKEVNIINPCGDGGDSEDGDRKASLRWTIDWSNWKEVIARAEELGREKLVLVVLNTVKRAMEFYKQLNLDDKVLIHGLMSESDKHASYTVIEKMCKNGQKEKRRGVIVATQVVEVGVDVDADVLISDLAPLENVVQRAGRLCRTDRPCEPQVIIIEPEGEFGQGVYDEDIVRETYKKLKDNRNIDLRLLDNLDNKRSYVDILEELYNSAIINKFEKRVNMFLLKVAEEYLTKEVPPGKLIDFLDLYDAWTSFRSSYLVKLLIEDGDPLKDYVTVSISKLKSLLNCLKLGDNCINMVVVAVNKNEGYVIQEVCSETIRDLIEEPKWKKNFKYGQFIKKLHKEISDNLPKEQYGYVDFYLVLRGECYERNRGLIQEGVD